jgi:hypothetical protein
MRRVLVLGLIFVLVVAAPAAAQTTNAPPGNSGLSQYLEVVPGSSGNTSSRGGKPKKALSAHAAAALAASGDTGQSLAAFSSKTAPSSRRSGSVDAVDANGRASALAASLVGSDGSSGMGIWLPILIAVAAAFALVTGWRRHSSGSKS